MYRRHQEVPVYEARDAELAACHYNLARIALMRFGEGIEFALPGLRSLRLVLQREAWIVVDEALNRVPVLAWLDFQPRASLDATVRCRLQLYHCHALMIVPRVLEALVLLLGERVGSADPAEVARFPGRPASGAGS